MPSVSIDARKGQRRGELRLFARAWSRWPDENGPMEVESVWAWDGDDVVCVELRARSYDVITGKSLSESASDRPARLSPTATGELPVARILRHHSRWLSRELPKAVSRNRTNSVELSDHEREVVAGAAAIRTPGRGRSTDGPDLALIAELFRQAEAMDVHDLGDGRAKYRPAAWVKHQLAQETDDEGRPDKRYQHVEVATVRKWRQRAKKAGHDTNGQRLSQHREES